jgi:hypothetical protein
MSRAGGRLFVFRAAFDRNLPVRLFSLYLNKKDLTTLLLNSGLSFAYDNKGFQ